MNVQKPDLSKILEIMLHLFSTIFNEFAPEYDVDFSQQNQKYINYQAWSNP